MLPAKVAELKITANLNVIPLVNPMGRHVRLVATVAPVIVPAMDIAAVLPVLVSVKLAALELVLIKPISALAAVVNAAVGLVTRHFPAL